MEIDVVEHNAQAVHVQIYKEHKGNEDKCKEQEIRYHCIKHLFYCSALDEVLGDRKGKEANKERHKHENGLVGAIYSKNLVRQ